MKTIAGRLVVLAALLTASTAGAADWATYRNDNRRSGVTAETPAFPLASVWKYEPPGAHKTAWQGPARRDAFHNVRSPLPDLRDFDAAPYVTVSGGKAAFGSAVDDSVHCLDAATGRELWTYTTDGPVRMAPTWHGGRVYFGSDDGHAYCLSGEGKLVWKVRAGAPRELCVDGRVISQWPVRTGVMVEGNRAYFAGSLVPWEPTYLCAVEAAGGQVAYRQTHTGITIQAAMLTSRGTLFAMQGRTTPLVFKLADGTPAGTGRIWGSRRFGGVHATITPDGRFFYTPGPTGYAAYACTIDAAIGPKPMHNPAAIGHVTRLVFSEKVEAWHVRGQLECRAVGGTGAMWQTPAPMPWCLVLAGNALLAGYDGKVTAYAVESGKVLWEAPTSGKAHGIAVAGGRVYVSTEDGTVECFGGK